MQGDPLRKKNFEKKSEKKCLAVPKKIERGDSFVSPCMICYAEKQVKAFWSSSLGQMVLFDTIIFCRTFKNYFGQFVWIEKKSHYNSRVSLHEAPTKKSSRYNIIKYSFQPQLGSGIKFVFLPSDPDELVDQLKLLYFEKVGGIDNPMLSEQIIAIADKLLQYQCITTNQHQNLISTFTKKDQFVEKRSGIAD